MSRKRQILELLAQQPRTQRQVAEGLGVTVSCAGVFLAELKALGVVKPVGEAPCTARDPSRTRGPVKVWGPA